VAASGDLEDSGSDSFDALLREAVRVEERAVRAPGSVVGGRYRLGRMVGRGGMGSVYAATHEITQKHVALKFLSHLGTSTVEQRRRFAREARAASAVVHPAVVTVFDLFESEEGEPVMVMELLEGETLRDRLAREGALTPGEAARLLAPIVSAVNMAHTQGIVHRDIKPENILLTRTPPYARILDFGVAGLRPDMSGPVETRLTRTGQRLGTVSYMAPEQVFGEADIDARADVWSLGAVLFECLSGRRFVSGASLAEVARELGEPGTGPSTSLDDIDPDLGGLIDRMLGRDRAERLEDLSTVEAHLSRLAREHGLEHAPFGAPGSHRGAASRWRRWSASRWIAAGALLLGIAAASAARWSTSIPDIEPGSHGAGASARDEPHTEPAQAAPPVERPPSHAIDPSPRSMDLPAPLPTSPRVRPSASSHPSPVPAAATVGQQAAAPRGNAGTGLIERVPF
jgi:serine/threonine protein kinase